MYLLWRDYRSGDFGESRFLEGKVGSKYNRSEKVRPDNHQGQERD